MQCVVCHRFACVPTRVSCHGGQIIALHVNNTNDNGGLGRSSVFVYRLSTKEMTQPIRLEDYPNTHDGAVDFLQAVFVSRWGNRAPSSATQEIIECRA